ncbi:type VII toxin-antitoxin system MntA family adenylyltransferase antitoxin [Nitrospira sp. Nam80]
MERSHPHTPDFAEVARRYAIQLILQFGSTVDGPVHPRSDLDLAILLKDADLSLEQFGDIQQSLQPCFPGRDVDLAIINRADPLFLKQILDRCRLLYGPIRTFQRLRLYAFKRYQDHRRFLDLERRFVNQTLDRLAARQ